MQSLVESYKKSKNLHHAYFLVGDKINILKELISFLEGPFGFETSGNPDFWIGQFDSLTIDDAREISQNSERKDFSGSKKVFIIDYAKEFGMIIESDKINHVLKQLFEIVWDSGKIVE
jgi:hypothetical protein